VPAILFPRAVCLQSRRNGLCLKYFINKIVAPMAIFHISLIPGLDSPKRWHECGSSLR
jgi:hypothetical protein